MRKNWFWGVYFILAALLLIAAGLGAFATLGFWSVFGAVLLVAVIIQSIRYRFWGGVFVPAAIIYLIFQTPLGWPFISAWVLIIAAIIISIGFHFIFKSKPPRYTPNYTHAHTRFASDSGDDNDNFPTVDVSFTSAVRYLHSSCLRGANLVNSFGSLEVYFDQATISADGADVNVDCKMGEMTLYIPREWRVEDQISRGVGDVKFNRAPVVDGDTPLIRLAGNVNMGDIKVVLT